MVVFLFILSFVVDLSAYGHEHDDYLPLILSNPYPDSTHSFGRAISLFEDQILVGALSNSTNAPDAFLFDVNSGELLNTFNVTGTKTPEGPQSVSLYNDWVLVGASREDIFDESTGGTISSAGAAYLFHAQTGELLHTFHHPNLSDLSSLARFGNAVAIYEDLVLIGSYQSGNAFLFNANTGDLIHEFIIPYDNANGRFGDSVSLSKEYALIGEPANYGSAFLYDLNTGNLVQTYEGVRGFSPESVSLDNELVLFGKTGGGDGTLPVYLYDVDGEFVQHFDVPTNADAKLNQDPVNVLDEDKVLISISHVFDDDYLNSYDIDDVNNLFNYIGRVFLHDVKTGGLIHTFNNPDPQKRDGFGMSLSMDNDMIAIGAPGYTSNYAHPGLVYVYDFQGSFSSLTTEIQDASGNILIDHVTKLATIINPDTGMTTIAHLANLDAVTPEFTTVNLLTDIFTNESITIVSDSINNYSTTQDVVYVITITQNDEVLSEQIISKTVDSQESISISLPFLLEKSGEYRISVELWNNQQEKKSVVSPIELVFTINDPVAIIEEDETVPLVENETVPLVENETVPLVENETVPLVENETVPLVENETVPLVDKNKVPSWVKNNVQWWVDGNLGDEDFASGIQHLVKEKIIDVSVTVESKPIPDFIDKSKDPQYYIDRYNNEEPYKEWFETNYSGYTIEEATGIVNTEIPSWVKNNAGWWAEGLLSEDDFLKGIEYLVEKQIIRVN